MNEPVHHGFVRCAAILGALLLLLLARRCRTGSANGARVVASARLLGPEGIRPVHLRDRQGQGCSGAEQPFREAKLARRKYGLRPPL